MPARIRGATLINTLAILREVLGASRFQAIVSSCPERSQQLIRRTLVASEWIPLDVWAPFPQAIFEQTCRGDEMQFRRLMRVICKRDFSTIYRGQLQLSSPAAVLSRSAEIWAGYFDTGSLTLDAANPTASSDQPVVLHMRGLETTFPLFAAMVHAYLEQMLSMAGAQRYTIMRAGERLVDGKLGCDYIIDLLPE